MAPKTNSGGKIAVAGPEALRRALDYAKMDHAKMEAELVRSLKVLMHPSRQGSRFGLLCVRVDAHDAVEALLGAAGVGQLLFDAYTRLRNCVRTTDMVGGRDGGIFFILATDLQSEDELEIISERIQRTCRAPYWIQDQEIRSGLTTGGIGGSEGDADPDVLTKRALVAMRRASSRGVAFEFFSPSATKTAGVPGELIGGEAEPATEAAELNFQPQFTADLMLSGAKADIRLLKRVKNPGDRVADRNKNERLGDRMLRQLLLQARSWTRMGLAVPAISIEIGANHLLNRGFADSLLKLLQETDTEGSAIDLLLTEATTLTSLGSAQRTLAVLAEAGVQFGLSGFSLNAGTRLDLRKLPFSSLRVSCTSLFKVTSARESLWLARSIVGVAHRCGLAVVGEDVATAEQRDILIESGCDKFEGALFSPAIAAVEMEALVRRGHLLRRE